MRGQPTGPHGDQDGVVPYKKIENETNGRSANQQLPSSRLVQQAAATAGRRPRRNGRALAIPNRRNMFTLEQVVPWGRSFDEYCRMFALGDDDLTLRTIGCGDGPASFNAEATRRGAQVVSCDPIYHFDAGQIRARIETTYQEVIEQTRRNMHEFVWTSVRSIDELGRVRMAAMNEFLSDFPAGKADGRYVAAELPSLPFADASFDLALSSHFLFLYSAPLGVEFHRSAVREMCRIANEVRIFPLLALGGSRSAFVDTLASEFTESGFDVSIDKVPYEFQRGGNQMMKIRRIGQDGTIRSETGHPSF